MYTPSAPLDAFCRFHPGPVHAEPTTPAGGCDRASLSATIGCLVPRDPALGEVCHSDEHSVGAVGGGARPRACRDSDAVRAA